MQTSSSSMEGSQERRHTWSWRRRRRPGALTATLAVALLASAPRNVHGFIRTPALRPPQPTRFVVTSLGAPHFQPPERTVPLPGPPEEWGGLPPERHAEFLREFWQRRPLLIRKAFDPSVAVVGPAELLGLACDDRVASRLIERWTDGDTAEGEWSVRQGPFDEEDFEEEENGRRWTVLVQEVDRHVPEVADLLNSFRFVPSWRVDDVMISYAPKEGGIGPHVDNYDVFLLQGRGTRRWRIQGALLGGKDEREGLIPNSPVRILADFEEDHSWVLQPGDMLYLPPRVPHDGVSLDGDCMTYSIGFRAPAQRELLAATAAAAQALLEGEGAFYTDQGLALPQPHDDGGGSDAGEITAAALNDLRGLIRAALTPVLEDDALFAQWMGRHLTKPRRPRLGGEEEEYPVKPLWAVEGPVEEEEGGVQGFPALLSEWGSAREVVAEIRAGGQPIELYRAEGITFAHAAAAGNERWLFADGKAWTVPAADPGAAKRVCALLTGGPSPLPCADVRTILLETEVEAEGEAGGAGAALEALLIELLDDGYLYALQLGPAEDEEDEKDV